MSLACAIAAASSVPAGPLEFASCGDLPASLAPLGAVTELESFGVARLADVAVASLASPTEEGRSVIKFSRGGEDPRSLTLSGRVIGLAVADDGHAAFAIVRATDRKGATRGVDLVRIDLGTGRATVGTSLPATARGLTLTGDGGALLVAARDEIRTFLLPNLASGPLYRVLGENVGVAGVAGSSRILVAQPGRVVRSDLAGTQGRDGLPLAAESVPPAPLRGMMASMGAGDPVALADGGAMWCIRGGDASPPVPEPVAAVETPQAPPPVVLHETPPPTPPALPAPPAPPATADARQIPRIPTESGTIAGTITGPARGEVAAVVVLGPDNVLREAVRAIPDAEGRYTVSGLQSGAYRIVASGKGGRVLICDPPFITVHVGFESAVEAPVLKALRAP